MNENIRALNKIFVDVPAEKVNEFLTTYYSPEVGQERLTNYDDKLAFLHGKHQIFTQGDVFGAVETTVGNNNSFTINGTKYTLTINNGELNIDPYTASSFNYTYFNKGTTDATNDQSCEYGTSYSTVSVTVEPSNTISYSINHGTTKILLTGIQAKNESGSYAYVYGGSHTITNNAVTKIGDTTITAADYVNGNINGSLTIPDGNIAKASTVTKTVNSGTASSTFTTAATTTTQTGIVYYHEYGKSTISKKGFTDNTPTTKSSKVTVYKGYFKWIASTYEEPTTTTGTTQKPSQISTNQSDGQYAWLAIPVAPQISSDGKTFEKPVFKGGVLPGGWLPYRTGDIKNFSNPLVTFTHYGETYYVYRTVEAGLGQKTWDIYDYPS